MANIEKKGSMPKTRKNTPKVKNAKDGVYTATMAIEDGNVKLLEAEKHVPVNQHAFGSRPVSTQGLMKKLKKVFSG